MADDCAQCHPSGLHHPRVLMDELARRHLLRPGPDLVVVVRNTTGEVLGVAELPDLESDGWGDGIAAAARRAGAGEWSADRRARDRTAHLVRRRLGRTVPARREFRGWSSWLNAGGEIDAYVGDWLLVTDHGWRNLLSTTGPAGTTPTLVGGDGAARLRAVG
jgi:hypothetical protein